VPSGGDVVKCELDEISVYYEVIGEGRPIVMLHGWPLDHRHMASDLEPVFQRRVGWKRIYPDLPGMGKTPGPEWITCEDQVLDVVWDFIDAVIPGERFLAVGTSYGAYLARGLVYRRAGLLDGVCLIIPLIVPDTAKRTLPDHVTLVQDPSLMAALEPREVEALDGFAVVQSREMVQTFREDVFPAVELIDEGFLTRLRSQYAFSFDIDVLSKPFEKPALFVMGRQDSTSGYRDAWAILENYPRATFAVLDRAGHGLGVEQRSLLGALVSEWLDRVEQATSP
jgi:pimeloyl-ACP methyl ester carboxylesterase